ncbi:MAG TPA: flagellar hook assembly protein FlgD [Nevskiaceae bacterium]|nr:flagellar hook assembly protein FlgD [Nevskiaceae bacterium]
MSTVPPTAASNPNPFANIGLTTPTGTSTTSNSSDGSNAALGLTAQNFMQLLMAQVNNQDPLNPMDSTAFLGQLAQLSTVSGIQQLNSNFGSLSSALTANQAVQAAGLVGHQAQVASGSLEWDGKTAVNGDIELPTASGKVLATITDAAGDIIDTLPLGSQPAGTTAFTWDGTDAKGNAVPPGTYQVVATATDNGQTTALKTLTAATIQGVNLGGTAGLTLDLSGIGTVPLTDVTSIQ